MINQSKKPLFDALLKYGLNDDKLSFDVPGHKRGKGISSEFKDLVGEKIFKIDINSLKPLDMLSHPTGVIKEAEDLYAQLYNCDKAYFLVNGSTSGIQNMILSAVKPNEKIIIPRNIHKSAINALVFSGAIPIYINPTIDLETGISEGLKTSDIINTINQNKDVKAILLLNPTYFGHTQNLKEIIKYCHDLDIKVIVDESHGAHFPYSDKFPDSAMKYGADMATTSVHKTAGALTQASVLLHNEKRISHSTVRSVINLAQTSSASYLLLSSLDMARHHFYKHKDEITNNIISLTNYLRSEIDKLPNISYINPLLNNDSVTNYDPSKLVLNTKKLGITGFELYDLLRDNYNIQVELGETNVVLIIISIGDDLETINKLLDALKDISSKYSTTKKFKIHIPTFIPKMIYTPREAFFMEKEIVDLLNSENKIAGKSIMIYPPGIPLVNPGELISKEVIDYYLFLNKQGNVTLGSDEVKSSILVSIIKE